MLIVTPNRRSLLLRLGRAAAVRGDRRSAWFAFRRLTALGDGVRGLEREAVLLFALNDFEGRLIDGLFTFF